MRILVTGGAGFIGSNLVIKLLDRGDNVIVLDNLSSGRMESIKPFMSSRLEFHRVDLLSSGIRKYMKDVDEVWHLAADGDVRFCDENPAAHMEQNFIATLNLLHAMKGSSVKKLMFTSTSAVYGNAKSIPTPEDYSPMRPISLYGASKLSSELAISGHCRSSGLDAVIFRLANVVGAGATRGVVHDFIDNIRKDGSKLHILGDGKQTKSFVHISECISAMLLGSEKSRSGAETFNIASEDFISVKRIADIVSEETGKTPEYVFSGGSGGWKGDVPVMMLDTSNIKERGWVPVHNSEEAVRLAAREILC